MITLTRKDPKFRFNFAKFKRDFHNGEILSKNKKLFEKFVDLEFRQYAVDKLEEEYGFRFSFIPDHKQLQTIYCSTLAHLKNRLHMRKMNGSTFVNVTNHYYFGWFRSAKDYRDHGIGRNPQGFFWKMSDQEKLVGKIVKKYLITDERYTGE